VAVIPYEGDVKIKTSLTSDFCKRTVYISNPNKEGHLLKKPRIEVQVISPEQLSERKFQL